MTAQLSLRWRRRCVTLITISAGAIVLLNLLAAVPSPIRYAGSLLLSVPVVICAWLLSDVARLWGSGRSLSSAERVVRDRSIVKAYTILIWLCLALAVALHLPAFDAATSAVAHGRVLTLIWTLLAATLVLPGLVAAWSESLGEEGSVGPAQLIRDRFRGGDAIGHIVALVLALIAAGLLAILVLPPEQQATVRIWAVAVAALAVLIAGLLVARPLLREVRTSPSADSTRK